LRARPPQAAERRSVRRRESTLEDSDYLFTVAEVAVALAGFAGLVSVIADRLGTQENPTELAGHRLQVMLVYSLTATGFALVPYLFFRAGLSSTLVWRLSSGLFLATWLLIFARALPASLAFARGASTSAWVLVYVGFSISVAGLLLLLLNTLGAFGANPAFAYLVALTLLLLAAARLFVRLFLSLLRPAA